MAAIWKDRNGSDFEQDAPLTERYSDEVMCAEWNPQIALVNEGLFTRTGKHVALPADLSAIDVDAFLKRMYEFQS